jgi:hypothetical protein
MAFGRGARRRAPHERVTYQPPNNALHTTLVSVANVHLIDEIGWQGGTPIVARV